MNPITDHCKRQLGRLYGRWLRAAPSSKIRILGDDHDIEWSDARLHACRITITGRNNRLEIGRGTKLWETAIELTGSNLVVRLGANLRLRGGTFIATDSHSRLEVGDGTTMTGPMIVAQGGHSIVLGRDCMVAYGSDIRCSDGHSIIDIASGRTLNPAADVRIGNHVWIGVHSQILKGSVIEDEAIVAARAVVTKPVPAGTIVAGNPARAIRTGVTWDRRRPPSLEPELEFSHATLSLRQGAELR